MDWLCSNKTQQEQPVGLGLAVAVTSDGLLPTCRISPLNYQTHSGVRKPYFGLDWNLPPGHARPWASVLCGERVASTLLSAGCDLPPTQCCLLQATQSLLSPNLYMTLRGHVSTPSASRGFSLSLPKHLDGTANSTPGL